MPPQMSDREPFSEGLGVDLQFSDFIAGGKWNVDDVLRPIYEEASQALGRDFPYPGDDGSDDGIRSHRGSVRGRALHFDCRLTPAR